MDILYEILGIILLLGIFVFAAAIQETLVKKFFPTIYTKLVHDYNDNEEL